MKPSIYITIVVLMLGNLVQAQDRRTHYLHGLNDNAAVWRIYEPTFEAQRRMNATAHEYNNASLVGVRTSETFLENRIAGTQNYLIGHSMGGLVARELERQTPIEVNAIITIGTPNNGAFVATNVRSGMARNLINRAINDLSTGPVSEGKSIISNILSFTGIPGWLASRWAGKQVDKLAEDFWGQINERVINLENGLENALVDLSPNSAVLNTLNNRTTNTLIANIVLEENDRPGLRLANAVASRPENTPLHGYDDADFIRTADKVEAAYKAFRIYHDAQKILKPWRFKHHNVLANKWHQGEDYIDDKFDADHAKVVGATRTETRTSTYWVQECRCLRVIDDELAPIGVDPCDGKPTFCNWVQKTSTFTVTINEPSDGLVTNSTQRMASVSNDRVYGALGAGHLEVENHPRVTDRFNDIFNRTDVLGIRTR